MSFNETAASFQAKLQALSTVGSGNALVTKSGNVFTIEFRGVLANANVSDLTLNTALLTGGTATASITQQGSGGALVPKEIYVAWNTNWTNPAKYPNDDTLGGTSSHIMVAASGDGGANFTTQEFVNSLIRTFDTDPDHNTKATYFSGGASSAPQVAFVPNSAGTKLAFVWGGVGLSKTGIDIDQTSTDGGILNNSAAVSQIFTQDFGFFGAPVTDGVSGTAGVNEVQTVTISNNQLSGTYTLTFTNSMEIGRAHV